MKIFDNFKYLSYVSPFLLIIISSPVYAFFDQDSDGITDAADNCTLLENPTQYDSNNDGIGNLCDSDLNNDGSIDHLDYLSLIDFAQTNNLDGDLNEDGVIDISDANILIADVGTPPGPFGTNNSDLYERPRILASKSKLASLATKLNVPPYDEFWKSVKLLSIYSIFETPPCPEPNLSCDAPGSTPQITPVTAANIEAPVRRFGDALPFMALAYRLTGNSVYLDGARKWMNALVSWEHWGANTQNGAAHLLIGMSTVYDWLYDDFTETERQLYREKMIYHTNILYTLLVTDDASWWQDQYLSNHNYTDNLAIALAGIALYGETSDADYWLAAVRDNYSNVLGMLSPDGAAMEGAAYWTQQMTHMLQYFIAMSRFAPEVGSQMAANSFFQNAASFRLYATLPDFIENVDFSDSPRRDYYGPSGYILRALASIYSDPYAQWLAERIDNARMMSGEPVVLSWQNMLWYSPEIPQTPPTNLPLYKYFDDLGILITRSSWQEDAFWSFHKSGPYQGYHAESLGFYPASHAHPDEGQFLAWSQGRWLLIEDGFVFLKRTENHNLLTFNNTGQFGGGNKWINDFEIKSNGGTVYPVYSDLSDGAQYIVTEIAPIYRAAADVSSWQRSFISLPEGYQVIRDDVVLNNPGQVDSLVHGETIASSMDGLTAILNPRNSVPEATDRSGNGHNGTLVGGYAVTGVSAKALHLEGVADKVAFTSLHHDAFPTTGSMSFWIRLQDFINPRYSSIFDHFDILRNHIFIRASSDTASYPLQGLDVAFQSENSAEYSFENHLELSLNQWHHLVITWDTGINRGQIYLDNTLVYEADITNSNWMPSGQIAAFGHGFKGAIDEARLFNRALDSTEVNALFNLESDVSGAVSYWSFDGLDDASLSNFREYSYRIVYPTDTVLNVTDYFIPPEEQDGPQGNYVGRLLSATRSNTAAETIIHFVGDVSTPVSYDADNNELKISHGAYDINIDFDARSVTR